jgi:hypothetical protein
MGNPTEVKATEVIPTESKPNDLTTIDKKRIELDKLKSLEDSIIHFIQQSGQNNKSIFLSMLINYVMCYNDEYTTSISELNNNKGEGFEEYIKDYLLKLLRYYEKNTTLDDAKVSFSQIKLMLLKFFHTKISPIPSFNQKSQFTRSGQLGTGQQQISIPVQQPGPVLPGTTPSGQPGIPPVQQHIGPSLQPVTIPSGIGLSGPIVSILPTTTEVVSGPNDNVLPGPNGEPPPIPIESPPEDSTKEFETEQKGGFKTFSELSDSISSFITSI